jgi:hypothetical protein
MVDETSRDDGVTEETNDAGEALLFHEYADEATLQKTMAGAGETARVMGAALARWQELTVLPGKLVNVNKPLPSQALMRLLGPDVVKAVNDALLFARLEAENERKSCEVVLAYQQYTRGEGLYPAGQSYRTLTVVEFGEEE